MLRVRSETAASTWRLYRWALYPIGFGIVPFVAAGALSIGGPFGTTLLGGLVLSCGVFVFAVEYVIRMGRKPNVYEFDSQGLRITLGGQPPRTIPWTKLTAVRVRAAGGRDGPPIVMFQFRGGLLLAAMSVDMVHHREIAEQVASLVARNAPQARKTGRTDAVRWDPTLDTEGDLTIGHPPFRPSFYAVSAVTGTAYAVLFTAIAAFLGFVRSPGLLAAMVVAYVALGGVQVILTRRAILTAGKASSPPAPNRTARALLAAASTCVVLEALLGVWLVIL